MSGLAVAILGGWLAIGVVAVAVMRRRGHDTFAWAVPFLFLGPLAVPLAITADRHRPVEPPRPLPPGGLDLLVAHDGTADSQAALDAALGMLGPQMTSVTLAAVVDIEASSTVRGEDTQREAQERLDVLAGDVSGRTAVPVATVILFGEPAHALQHYALENGYELIVAGSRLAAKAHLRTRPGGQAKSVPVLIGPT
ncbi:MAG TPA: universal stress protein [Acidimicrobiales bacterium]